MCVLSRFLTAGFEHVFDSSSRKRVAFLGNWSYHVFMLSMFITSQNRQAEVEVYLRRVKILVEVDFVPEVHDEINGTMFSTDSTAPI